MYRPFVFLRFFLFFTVILVAIEAVLRIGNVSPAAIAFPSEIIPNLFPFLTDWENGRHLFFTAYRSLLSFLVSIPLGVLSGCFVQRIKPIKQELVFLLDFFRSIPATTLVPVFFLLFGPSESARLAASIYTGTLSISVAVLVGFNGLSADRAIIADSLKLRGIRRFTLYELPEMTPSVFVGLRTAASLCLILVVVSEMFIGSHYGLGRLIMDTRYSDNTPLLYASILWAGILGFSLNYLLIRLEKLESLPKPD